MMINRAISLMRQTALILAVAGGFAAGVETVQIKFQPQSYTYVLQAEKLAVSREKCVEILAGCGRDAIIIDAFFSGDDGGRWTRQEIDAIRGGKAERKVISYLSIGEAENYRAYWQAEWQQGKPEFLLAENPNWAGNFKVRYWSQDWQKLILAELKNIVASGFDGVMLDIVDGFVYFEQEGEAFIDNRVNPATGNTYRQDMQDFVQRIAVCGRTTREDFLVIPQNGAQLLADEKYAQTVSAQALESLFTLPDKKQSPEHQSYVLQLLKPLLQLRKPVLLTEYCKTQPLQDYAALQAKKNGLILLLTAPALEIIGTSR